MKSLFLTSFTKPLIVLSLLFAAAFVVKAQDPRLQLSSLDRCRRRVTIRPSGVQS